MDSVSRAAEVLSHAEASLRELVSKAATSGDYVSVVQIAAWAQTVADLVKKSARHQARHATVRACFSVCGLAPSGQSCPRRAEEEAVGQIA